MEVTELYTELKARHEAGISEWSLVKRMAEVFVKDLRYYIDFLMACFLVWRELRRERESAKNKDIAG
ncbi:MAG TPA: hypothetical protein VNN73_20490 [Blastocatellia bacterium]|nr:hypothetical protein [Blastocatellia bacterium]